MNVLRLGRLRFVALSALATVHLVGFFHPAFCLAQESSSGPIDTPDLLEPSTARSQASAPVSTPVSDRELGQLLLIGFSGQKIGDSLSTSIRAFHPGGILLFGRNVRTAYQVAELTTAAQRRSISASQKPLLIAIDQEGGNVIRLRHAPPLPSALAISQTHDPEIAEKAGQATGRLLRALGINTNLAPVADISDPSKERFLGTRTYGNNPELVGRLASRFAIGLQRERVLPVAKHFPGHGDASGDSHFAAATSLLSRSEVLKQDLVPYKALASLLEFPWGIMLAHVSFPKIDSSGLPATFSQKIVQGLLRRELGDEVLVITDDIEMAGANAEADVGIRAVRAIEAGADMIMIAWSLKVQKKVLSALQSAVASGRLSSDRIRQSLRRIEAAKSHYITSPAPLPSFATLKSAMQNPLFSEVGDSVLRAFELDAANRKPASATTISRGPDPIVLLSPRLDFISSFRAGANGYPVKAIHLKSDQLSSVERELINNPNSKIIAYASGPQAVRFLSKLDDGIKGRIHLVSVETAAMIPDADRFLSFLLPYYRHPKLGRAVAGILLDKGAAEKKAPPENARRQPQEPPETTDQ